MTCIVTKQRTLFEDLVQTEASLNVNIYVVTAATVTTKVSSANSFESDHLNMAMSRAVVAIRNSMSYEF